MIDEVLKILKIDEVEIFPITPEGFSEFILGKITSIIHNEEKTQVYKIIVKSDDGRVFSISYPFLKIALIGAIEELKDKK